MSEKSKALILWFEELTKDDVPLVGGKCANLGEMTRAGIPVPPGFAVTAYAYKKFIEETGIVKKIYEILGKTIKEGKPEEYQKASRRIRELIEKTPMPKYIEDAIRKAYRELCKRLGMKDVPVAVRSSATAEDLPGASFAGQQETYLNVIGENEVVEKVKKCWSSLFTARAIFYREEKGFKHEKVLISVAVQKMVNAKAAGVMFTIHPVTGDENKIVIEGNWGLGETVVGGRVTPDEWVVDKNTLKILEERVSEKTEAILKDPITGKSIEIKLPKDEKDPLLKELEKKNPKLAEVILKEGMFSKRPCLKPEEVKRLAELGKLIEKHYGTAQDIEWAIDRDLPFPKNVFIVQSRPETVWSVRKKKAEVKVEKVPKEEAALEELIEAGPKVKLAEAKPVVQGLAASPGVAIGRAKVCLSVDEARKLMRKGDILVTVMTNPDWVPYMRLASAIVTDEGGMTCHAAIVSRELGIPCIVGARKATKALRTGQVYTVDAKRGIVYEGIVEELASEVLKKLKPKVPAVTVAVPTIKPEDIELIVARSVVTGTKVYMNLGVPEKIDEYKHLPFDGIGLMRIEFILASYIGEHPLYLIEIGKEEKFINKLAEGIAHVARAVYPRPVVVRFSDFKTNEYRQLKGGEKYEPHEDNPMLGWRGVSRYISPQYRKAFILEIKAIKKVREEYGLKNVWVMAPFVRTLWEAEEFINLLAQYDLVSSRDFKVWFMAEVPSVIVLADEFCKYCDGFSIGSNDLTQLTLGTDRDSAILPKIDPRYFDERDPAVKRMIAHLIKVAHKHGRTVSICGQAPSVYPEFCEFLVRCGIDSISVNPDVVVRTKLLVARIERRILLEKAMGIKRLPGEEEWKF